MRTEYPIHIHSIHEIYEGKYKGAYDITYTDKNGDLVTQHNCFFTCFAKKMLGKEGNEDDCPTVYTTYFEAGVYPKETRPPSL
jgi:hypothetical protein